MTRPAPRLTLVLGGARSGKSAMAERLAAEAGIEVLYVATAEPLDEEMRRRIERHRQRRDGAWRTLEAPLALAEAIAREAAPGRLLIVDCLTLWLSNLLLTGRDVAAERAHLLAALESSPGPVLLVSNEVGQGIVPTGELARRFIDEAGFLHQAVAAVADRVVLMVAGLPLELKPAEEG
jgi:adenosylcobinamide kinase/adenosylcobinamide-phosphate guanylyltransferase